MANIGSFKKSGNDYQGALHTLSVQQKNVRIVGKPAKVALTACMRKLLTMLNAMVRDEQSWNQAKCA